MKSHPELGELSELPTADIRAVFTDLDDTLTQNGLISPDTYRSLCQLKESDQYVVIVSGRPAGWADALMRVWPIDAMIFENGAGVVIRRGPKLERVNLVETAQKESTRQKLQQAFDSIQKSVPSLKLATDQPFRLYDFAIDFGEEPPFLDSATVDQIMEQLETFPDIQYKLSSIHINYWVGSQTKLSACRYLIDEMKDWKLSIENVVYVGDSPNDEPLFGYFKNSVGVKNLEEFFGRLKVYPKYLAKHSHGKGFEEVVQYVLKR